MAGTSSTSSTSPTSSTTTIRRSRRTATSAPSAARTKTAPPHCSASPCRASRLVVLRQRPRALRPCGRAPAQRGEPTSGQVPSRHGSRPAKQPPRVRRPKPKRGHPVAKTANLKPLWLFHTPTASWAPTVRSHLQAHPTGQPPLDSCRNVPVERHLFCHRVESQFPAPAPVITTDTEEPLGWLLLRPLRRLTREIARDLRSVGSPAGIVTPEPDRNVHAPNVMPRVHALRTDDLGPRGAQPYAGRAPVVVSDRRQPSTSLVPAVLGLQVMPSQRSSPQALIVLLGHALRQPDVEVKVWSPLLAAELLRPHADQRLMPMTYPPSFEGFAVVLPLSPMCQPTAPVARVGKRDHCRPRTEHFPWKGEKQPPHIRPASG